MKKASAAGVRFGPDELLRLMYFCDREVMNTLVENASGRFTSEQIEELGDFADDEVLRRAAKRSACISRRDSGIFGRARELRCKARRQ